MYMKCGRCKGSKSVIGLGCVKKTCHVCDGVGYVKEVVQLKGNECDDRKEEASGRVRRKTKKEADRSDAS